MRKNFELDCILQAWRAEASVKNGIGYKVRWSSREKDSIPSLDIYTAQPMRMENLITKYQPILSGLPIFNSKLVVNIIKVDRCLH